MNTLEVYGDTYSFLCFAHNVVFDRGLKLTFCYGIEGTLIFRAHARLFINRCLFLLLNFVLSSHYHNAQASSKQAASIAAPPSSRLAAALFGEDVEDEPMAEGVPVPLDGLLMIGDVESVPLAFEDLPVYLVC